MSIDPHSTLLVELFDALQIEELRRCDAFGLPCLRGNDQIVVALNSKNHSLIIKLPASRVRYLVTEAWGQFFSPADRIHPEWVGYNTITRHRLPNISNKALRNYWETIFFSWNAKDIFYPFVFQRFNK